MFTNKLSTNLQDLMGLLGSFLPPDTYLAGGTALALHLNHRSSFDLDLYTPKEFDELMVRQQWETNLPNFSLTSSSWQTVIGNSNDSEVSIFYYQYPLVEPTAPFKSLKIASISDIACMKVEAVSNRGMKRDFFDLYTICNQTELTLEAVINLVIKKYQRDQSDLPHVFKSLVYFDDAERLPERAQIVDAQWQKVKEFFTSETTKVMSNFL